MMVNLGASNNLQNYKPVIFHLQNVYLLGKSRKCLVL